MSDVEEDEVLYELPVFLSASKAPLHVVSYPLRVRGRPYDSDLGSIQAARLKTRHCALQLDYDVKAPHDPERGIDFRSFRLNSRRVYDKTNYATALLKDGKVFLAPVSSVQDMRPDLEFVDEAAKRNAAAERGEDIGNGDGAAAPDVPLKEVLLKAARNRVPNAAVRKSYMNLKQEWDAEKWIPLTVQSAESAASMARVQRLMRDSTLPLPFDEGPRAFLSVMCGSELDASSASARAELQNQVVDLLKNAGVVRFSRLCDAVGVREDDNAAVQRVLKVLNRRAVLVRNCWVAKSALMFCGRVAACRDYLLSVFVRTNRLRRSCFSKVAQLDPEATNLLLQQLAVYDASTREWVFKGQHGDDAFAIAYPEVVEAQQEVLAEIRTSCFQILGVESFDESDDEMMLDASDVKPAASRAATKTKKVQAVEQPKLKMKKEEQRQEPSPEMKVKVETKEQNDPLAVFVLDMIERFDVCSRAFLLRQANAVPDHKLGVVSAQQLNAVLQRLTKSIGSSLVCRRKLNIDEFDRFRDSFIKLFAENPTKSFRKGEVRVFVEKITGDALPDRVYSRMMRELAVSGKGGTWTLKSGDYDHV